MMARSLPPTPDHSSQGGGEICLLHIPLVGRPEREALRVGEPAVRRTNQETDAHDA